MYRFLVIFLLLLKGQTLFGQSWSPKDSIRLSSKNKPNILIGGDKRNSFVTGVPVRILGFRGGLDYGKYALLGAIYTASADKLIKIDHVNTYDYLIFSGIGEYHWYKTHRFRIFQTIQAGIGIVDMKEYDEKLDKTILSTKMVIPLETGVSGNIRVLKYFGLTAGIGVRVSLTSGTYYSAPYYTYGVMVFTKDLVKDIKKAFE